MEHQSNLNLLIISFYFPPYNKVGGRRWAKHCKYLQKEGINFKVLAGDFDGQSPWDKDIETYNENITRVPLRQVKKPFHLKTLPSSFLQKLKWKLSLSTWKVIKQTKKGNYNDISAINQQAFFDAAKQLVKTNSITEVILSVGPFGYSSILNKLKKEFPNLKTIIDYRDYWEDEFVPLTKKQIQQEINKQNDVLKTIDLVTSPNEEMKDFYTKKVGHKSYQLPHCYDTDDIKIEITHTTNENSIRLIYGGAFYPFISDELKLINTFVTFLNTHIHTQTDFYVSLKGYENELRGGLINRYDFLPSGTYFKEVIKCDYVILILGYNRVNAMSSKFFELVALRKPILYFGGKGKVSEFIENNKLGFHVSMQNINTVIQNVIDNKKMKLIPDGTFDINSYSFQYQTKQLIKTLQSL